MSEGNFVITTEEATTLPRHVVSVENTLFLQVMLRTLWEKGLLSSIMNVDALPKFSEILEQMNVYIKKCKEQLVETRNKKTTVSSSS